MNYLFVTIIVLVFCKANSQITPLYEGQPYSGAVLNDAYIYFSFDVQKENCAILISLTTLDDGDPDLLVSYGSDPTPTLANAQFTSISKQRTELIEISNLDIYPIKSMSGTWTIGVYGRTAATFSLTVLYEDQKTVELKVGIPFEMYLKENSLMQFKFHHELNTDIEIKLNQFSGDLDAYVVNIQNHENSLISFPNETYFDWKIDTKQQSVLKIHSDDKGACVNCLYLISLKTKSASKFIISVLEDSKFIIVQNGLHYQERLRSQETKSYVFTSSNADEIYLDCHIIGDELRVYSSQNPAINTTHHKTLSKIYSSNPNGQIVMRKTAFVQENIWDGNQEIPSEKNLFYFIFENPTASEVNYSFVIRTKESNVVLRPGTRIETRLESKDPSSWIFYSSHDNEIIKIVVDFRIPKHQESDNNEIEGFLKHGLPIWATYLSEGGLQGEDQAISLTKGEIMNDQIGQGSIYSFRQVISTLSKKGKFVFETENPFSNPIVLGVRLFRSELGSFNLDQNAEHISVLEKGHSENIEIFLGHQGIWYLWAYACSGEVEVSLHDSLNELELESSAIRLKQGQDHLYQTYHPSGGVKVVKISRNAKTQQDTQFYISSSYFSEEKVYEFEPNNDYYHVSYDYNFNPVHTVVYITLSFIEITDLNPNDSIVYYVRLCPSKDNNNQEERNMCSSEIDCMSFYRRFLSDNPQPTLQARFDNVQQGSYFIKSVANIYHRDKLVRFVPYPIKTIKVGPESFLEDRRESGSQIGYVLLGMLTILLIGVLGFFCCRRLKSLKARSGLEMQNFSENNQYEVISSEESQSF